jgi:protein-disulfide isomerase
MSTARGLVDVGSSVTMAFVAVVMLGMYVHDRRASTHAASFEPLQNIDNWRAETARGIPIGDPASPVVITAFMDLQCPFCRRLHFVLDTLRSEHPESVGVVYQHYPLANHPHAERAAVVAECGERQDRFREVVDARFVKQDSLGVKSWRSFGADANVPDQAAFARCVTLPADSFPRIAAGRILGDHTGVRGTPTVWVNGNRIGRSALVALREWVGELGKGSGK